MSFSQYIYQVNRLLFKNKNKINNNVQCVISFWVLNLNNDYQEITL